MRKLAICGASYSIAVYLAVYAISVNMQLGALFVVAVGAFISLFIFKGSRNKVLLIAVSFAVGIAWTYVHYQIFIAPAESLTGHTLMVNARVIDFPTKTANSESVKIKLIGENLPKATVMLYSYGDSIDYLCPGDEISVNMKFTSAITIQGQEVKSRISKGVYQVGYIKGKVEYLGKWTFWPLYFPKYLSIILNNEVERSFAADVAPLMTTLATGDTTKFWEDVTLENAMSRAGVIHVVSVGGMHLSFMIGFISQFTGNRRKTALICVPMILIFMPLTGNSPAVVRSGIMQMGFLLSQVVRRESDTVTSLVTVFALILMQNPESAANIGLQLSFTATAGLFAVTPRVRAWIEDTIKLKRKNKYNLALRNIVFSSLSSTVGAMVFTLPLSAFYFDKVSLVSPISNVLLMEFFSIAFNFGFAAILLGLIIPPLGRAVAFVVSVILRFIIIVVKALSALPFAAIYTSNVFIMLWLILFYIVFIISYLLKGKRGYRPIVPTCLAAISLCTIMILSFVVSEYGYGSAAAVDVGQGQSIAITSGKSTVVIDCGGTVLGGAGNATARYLGSKNRHRIDLLVLTHLHADHAQGVPALMAKIPVKRIAMPVDDEDEDDMLPDILAAAEKSGTEIYYIKEDTQIFMDRINLTLYAPLGTSSTNERGVIILSEIDGFKLLVTGDVDANTEDLLLSSHEMPDINLFIAGHHGSRYSSGDDLLDVISPDIAIISSGRSNNYGHPTGETLERLQNHGSRIYRTDLSGTVEVRIPKKSFKTAEN